MAIACGLMPLLALWVVQSELIWYTGHSTAISLFYHVTFVILLIALANLAVARYWPKRALDAGEVMTIYVMLSVAGTLCSHDLLQILIPMISYPTLAANPQNRWDEIILSHVPSWSIVTDIDVCRGLAVGNSTLYDMRVLAAWAKPLAFWGFFLIALMGALLFINILFRQPWTEKERLSFPIIQIPLLVAAELPSLLRNRLFWLGFGGVALLDTWNGFSFIYPNLPEVPIVKAFEFREYFVERPWNAIANTQINLYPFVIGLTFFLPVDLAFSCWFFFLFFKLQIVLTTAIGFSDVPGAPFTRQQSAGGYLALGLLAIWLARKHLLGVWRRVLGRPGGADEAREPVSYRVAVFGLVTCFIILCCCGKSLGATWPAVIIFFMIFFVYSLAIARMRAELGPPAHDLHAMGPEMIMHNAVGTRALGEGNVTAFSLFFFFNRAYRAHFSAHSIEAFKIAQLTRIRSRAMMVAVVIALVVGLASAYWALLHSLYVHGYSGRPAGTAFSQQAWTTRMVPWMSFPQGADIPATLATVGGLLFSLLLGFLRTTFTWWAWHPVGYATASTWSMEKLWCCIMIGWAAKALITRYGGATAFRKAMPFFVGLVLGEFVVGSLWCIWGAVMSRPVYHFWG